MSITLWTLQAQTNVLLSGSIMIQGVKIFRVGVSEVKDTL